MQLRSRTADLVADDQVAEHSAPSRENSLGCLSSGALGADARVIHIPGTEIVLALGMLVAAAISHYAVG